MKRSFFIALAFLLPAMAFSQNITGTWEGDLEVQGAKIPIVFHIATDSGGKFIATFDSPSQKVFNLSCNEVVFNGDSLTLFMKVLNGKYAGKINEDKKRISGTWFQGPGSLPLVIIKTSNNVKIKEVKHPQTPVPPFPYRSEDVEYDNADKTVHFGASFTLPIPGPNADHFRAPVYPTILLITGSGKQDRDESIMGHKPFAVIADYLTRHGFAVLRVDDRDMGKTTGNFSTSTTADFASDVEAGIDYLKTRKEVDSNFIGLIGHSEGGMIAPMVASRRTDVKFIVLLAGPGIKISELMEQQSADLAASNGTSKKGVEKFRLLYRQLVQEIIFEDNKNKAYDNAVAAFRSWQKDNSPSLVRATTGVTDEKSMKNYVRSFMLQINSPWYSYFIKFNPAQYLIQVKCPVLALNGEKDIQVAAKPNLSGIEAALKKSNNTNYKIQEIPGLNHLFQHCKKCTVEEYADLEESFAPEVLEIIANWIKAAVK